MISLCLLLHVWSLLYHENISFNKHLGKELGGGGGDNIGIVENSVMVAEGKLHCSDLDGTEVIARDNSNNYGRNFI